MPLRSLYFLCRAILSAALLTLPFHVTAGEPLPIGQLLTQEYWVVIHAGPDGPWYTIKTLDGIVLQEGVSALHLASLYPGVYETLNRGIAAPPAPASSSANATEKKRPADR
ncbi:MAG: hypothetical protein O7E57_10805 [Gammaproteobacteria bacterium]|nr:hypothetical protein [Gammaproteobacteria bacterium]